MSKYIGSKIIVVILVTVFIGSGIFTGAQTLGVNLCATGPQDLQGDIGEVDSTESRGDTYAPSPNNTTWFNSGIPALDSNGDYYPNIATNEAYKKDPHTWPGGVNIEGATDEIDAKDPYVPKYESGQINMDALKGQSVSETNNLNYADVPVDIERTDAASGIQVWQKTYGGTNTDYGYSVVQTSDGGFIIAGYTYSFGAGGSDVYLVKTDANGNQIWQKTYGGTNNDFGEAVVQTSDGGFAIAGITESFGAGARDVYLVKTDASGNLVWQKTYGGTSYDYGGSVVQTSDGGFIIAGYTNSFGAGGTDVFLVKTDVSGNLVWQKTYGGTNYDYGYCVVRTSDSGFVVAGYTNSFGAGDSDVYLVKTDASGNQVWQKTYGGTNAEYSFSVVQTSDSGFVISGRTSSFGAGGSDVYLVKTDASGNQVWQKTYGGTNAEYGECVVQTNDSGFVVAGYTYSFGAGGSDVYLVKTDASGNQVWQKTYGGTNAEYGRSVVQTNDSGFVVAGYTFSFGVGGGDLYLVKTDATSGIQLWQKTYGGTSYDYGRSVVQTSDGGFIIAGYTNSFGAGNEDVYLVKTDTSGNQIWQKTYGGTNYDYGYAVVQTSDGGFIIAGETSSFGAGGSDVYLVKTDASGNLVWQKTYGGTNYDSGRSVVQTSDGGFVISGRTSSFGAGDNEVYLVRTDAGGNLVWQKTYGGTNADYDWSVVQTSDGGFAVTGFTLSFGAGGFDVYLVRTDANGNLVWQKTYGGTNYDSGHDVVQTSDGGFIIAGETGSFGAGARDVYLVKTDAGGNLVWQKTYGGTNYDYGYAVVQTSDGGFIIAGETVSFGAEGSAVYLVKTDAGGNLVWQKTYGGTSYDYGECVVQTSDGGLVVAGVTYSFGAGGSDFYLVKTDETAITLASITVNSGGSHYTTPAILLIGGGGFGATANAHVSNGRIYRIDIINPGSGYMSAPTVVVVDPNPRATGAIATVNIN